MAPNLVLKCKGEVPINIVAVGLFLYYIISFPFICLKKYPPIGFAFLNIFTGILLIISPCYLVISKPFMGANPSDILWEITWIAMESIASNFSNAFILLWLIMTIDYCFVGIRYQYIPSPFILQFALAIAVGSAFPLWILILLLISNVYLAVKVLKK